VGLATCLILVMKFGPFDDNPYLHQLLEINFTAKFSRTFIR